MRAVLRLGIAVAAAALAFGQPQALAQSAPPETTNTPAPATIGPRELQDFNLKGRVTRPSENPPAAATPPQATTPEQEAPRPAAARAASEAPATARQRPRATAAVERAPSPSRVAAAEARRREAPPQTPKLSSITVDLPPVGASSGDPGAARPIAAAAPAFSGDEDAGPGTLAPQHGAPLWPWLLAAMALGGGAAFLFWRRNGREAFAGGPRVDEFVAPPPAPPVRAPVPAPAPKPRPASSPPSAAPPIAPKPEPAPPPAAGIVSTRLRPWIDISFEPVRCVVEDEQVMFEFELQLYNSGSSPAQDLLVEATMVNASPTQDQEIGDFFGNPVGQGERIAVLQPLKRVNLRPKVFVARDKLRVLDAGGRKLFVPLIAFNALYRWSKGKGQTSAAYLLARDTKGEKMAPFRLDLGPRVFRGVGARALPISLRN